MEGIINRFFDFLTNKSISLSKRSILTIILIGSTILVNDYFGFTYNYSINQKLNQLNILYQIYPTGSTDSIQLLMAMKEIEESVLMRESFIIKSFSFIGNILGNKLSANQIQILWRLFSGSILFIILALIFPFTNNKSELKEIYLGLILLVIIVNGLLFLFPTYNNIIINHIINVGGSILLLIIFGIIGNKT